MKPGSDKCVVWLAAIVVLLLLLVSGLASAQPAVSAPPPTAATPPPTPSAVVPTGTSAPALDEPPEATAADKAKAKKHFLKGLRLLGEQAWAPALAEFKLSRKFYATRVATNNAAIALRRLQRYDEALDMFETLLRDFKVRASERQKAQRQIAELRSLVGTIDISGAEPGASIVVSGESRGEYPPVKPIRVPSGNHVVRVFKTGFQPFETRIDVAGGQLALVNAKLERLTDSGQLKVTEQTGRIVEVVVDNVTVGKTPWQGTLSVGSHVVVLRGKGKAGSQPAAAVVASQKTTTLALLAVSLEASLRVNPTPPGASVWINSVNVGNGVWLGRLKTGPHKVEVKSEGFLSQTRDVTLKKGQREVLSLQLERDEDAPRWRKPSKWTVEATASVLLIPTLGGDVADGCGDGCSADLGLGGMALVHGGYELGSGLGFGLEAGYLAAWQGVSQRNATLKPNGFSAASNGSLDEELRLSGFLAGLTVGYHFGETFPIQLRLGAGVLVGNLRDERSGSFTAQQGGVTSETYPLADFPAATYVYLDPTVRVGYRFAEHFEVSAAVQALIPSGTTALSWQPVLTASAPTPTKP